MYYIRYVDPMTGLSFDYKSESLDEIVRAVSRAKNDLYYKGYASADTLEAPAENATSKTEVTTEINNEAAKVAVKSDYRDQSEADVEDDDDDNPYGYWF